MAFDAVHMGDATEWDEVEALGIFAETAKAVLVRSDFGYEMDPVELWVPRSVIENGDDYHLTGRREFRITVQSWWVENQFEEDEQNFLKKE